MVGKGVQHLGRLEQLQKTHRDRWHAGELGDHVQYVPLEPDRDRALQEPEEDAASGPLRVLVDGNAGDVVLYKASEACLICQRRLLASEVPVQ